MSVETAPVSLQESMLTALAFSGKEGTQIAAQVDGRYFDDNYRPLAELLLKYRREHHKAPGRAHLDDLVDTAVLRRDTREETLRIVSGMVTQYEEGFNARWTADRTSVFVRDQVTKAAIIEGSDIYQSGSEDRSEQVARIWLNALRHQHAQMDPGLFLNDPRGFAFLDKLEAPDNIKIGIPLLDRRGVVPTPAQMLLYIATKGSGKSWFCVHCGRRARQQRARVMHITLEMSEEEVFQRYIQNWFGAAKTDEKTPRTEFEFDKLKRLINWKTKQVRPKINFEDPQTKKVLLAKQKQWGTRLSGLVIKRFPTGQLTVPQLVNYIDYMEQAHNFVPQVLIIDYPDLMRVDASNYRLTLGQIYVDLRGIAVERNLALITPTQGTRATLHAKTVRSSDVSEDKRKVDTADNVLTYSQTPKELEAGLARLHVAHARHAKGDFTVLLSQSYATGQYVLDSTPMNEKYRELAKAKFGRQDEDEGE
jgi:hypothetical protein